MLLKLQLPIRYFISIYGFFAKQHFIIYEQIRLVCYFVILVMQGCSLGLNVSVSRRSRDVVSKRLGLVETWGGLGLDLVSN